MHGVCIAVFLCPATCNFKKYLLYYILYIYVKENGYAVRNFERYQFV